MIPLLLIVLGLMLGSFVNAFVWRWHEKRNWVSERSECSHCHHKLGPLDLVPVFSWLFLKGKCRYCHKKIEDSPLVEITLPSLFLLSYFCWPLQLHGVGLTQFAFWLIFLVIFLALAVYDIRWFLLPDKIVFPAIGLAIIQIVVVAVQQKNFNGFIGAALGMLAVGGLFYIIFQISKGKWIGGGDVKLGLALGILAGGLLQGFLLLFFASVAGLLAALPMLVKGKANRKTHLPFGPFLIVGLIVVKLFGTAIVAWYTGLLYA